MNRHGTLRRLRDQDGLSVVELMVAMAMGLFILSSLTGLLLSSRASYSLQDQHAQVQETGRYALEVMARAIRQAGYRPLDQLTHASLLISDEETSVRGLDARTLKKNTPALEAMTTGVVNGSDVLALRFAGDEVDGKGMMFNCAGFVVPAALPDDEANGWSIFFVARDSAGEAELRCKYRTAGGWSADAIARGVESFQVLYGLDIDGMQQPLHYLSASAIDALDAGLPAAHAAGAGTNETSHWRKVRAVRVALLVGGSMQEKADEADRQYDLFGPDYADRHAALDKGVRIKESDLSAAMRHRLRVVFTQTIRLRNDPAGVAS